MRVCVCTWRAEQGSEHRDGTGLNHHLGVRRGTRGNVGQRPGSLELQLRRLRLLQKMDKVRDGAGSNDLIDRRLVLCGKTSQHMQRNVQNITIGRPWSNQKKMQLRK
jgi:hypothetical protein